MHRVGNVLWLFLGGYCLALAASSPFTSTSDGLVALGIAGFAGAAGYFFIRSQSPTLVPRCGGGGSVSGAIVWVAVVVVAAACELATYFSAPRASYPTLSSMLDAIDRRWLAKAAAVAAWIAVGLWLSKAVPRPRAGTGVKASNGDGMRSGPP